MHHAAADRGMKCRKSLFVALRCVVSTVQGWHRWSVRLKVLLGIYVSAGKWPEFSRRKVFITCDCVLESSFCYFSISFSNEWQFPVCILLISCLRFNILYYLEAADNPQGHLTNFTLVHHHAQALLLSTELAVLHSILWFPGKGSSTRAAGLRFRAHHPRLQFLQYSLKFSLAPTAFACSTGKGARNNFSSS